MIQTAYNSVRYCRRLVRCLKGQDAWYHREISVPLQRLGSAYGGWTICHSDLDRHAIVYSFGIGEDISFDLELIKSLGCDVHAFDPTPRSMEWLKRQVLPEKFHSYSYGLAGFDGKASFEPPANADHVSFSLTGASSSNDSSQKFPVRRLQSIMETLGHDHLDILKMDIEGAEYDAIDDIIQSDLEISQILVEFHHRFSRESVAKTRSAIAALQAVDYRIMEVSPSGEEYSFIRINS